MIPVGHIIGQGGGRRVGGRAVAAPVLLWWLNYWNLFGFML